MAAEGGARTGAPGGSREAYSVDAGGFLYGAVITGAALAVVNEAEATPYETALSAASIAVVLYIVHAYVRVLADRLRMPGARLAERVREALRHESAIVVGALPAIVVLVFVEASTADLGAAVELALWMTAAVLGGAGYLAARRAGVRGAGLFWQALAATSIGMAVVALDALLH